MPNISKLKVESTTYDIKDAVAREHIETLENKFENSTKPVDMNKVVFIGDSYSVLSEQTTWTDVMVNRLGLSSDEYYKVGLGSTGFQNTNIATGKRFIDLLEDAYETIEELHDTNNITHIIVGGGANDIKDDYTVASISGYIESFVEYANEHFPKAKIYIAMIGFTIAINLKKNFYKVLEAYSNCNQYGAIFLKGCENAIHYYPYFKTNGVYSTENTVHPNQEGSYAIGNAMYEALIKGYANVVRNWEALTCSAYEYFFCAQNNDKFYMRFLNNFRILKNPAGRMIFSPNFPIDVVTFEDGCIGGSEVAFNRFKYELLVIGSNQTRHRINGYLQLESFVDDDVIKQKLVFYPDEIEPSTAGQDGYYVVADAFQLWFTPFEFQMNIYDC